MTADDPCTLAILDLEEMARKYETRAGALRTAASTLRKDLGISVLGPTVLASEPAPIGGHVVDEDPFYVPERGKGHLPRPVRRTPAKPMVTKSGARDLEAEILTFLQAKSAPCTMAELNTAIRDVERTTVRKHCAVLESKGKVVKTGVRRAVRIGVPAVMRGGAARVGSSTPEKKQRSPRAASAADPIAASPSASTESVQVAAAAAAAAAAAETEQLLKDGDAWTYGRLRKHIGAQRSVIDMALKSLKDRKVIKTVPRGNETAYKLYTDDERAAMPQARSIAVDQVLDPHAVAQRLEQILSSGASYDLAELHRNMRSTFPTITRDQVTPVLDRFVLQHRLRLIPLGSTSRYQLLPRQAASA